MKSRIQDFIRNTTTMTLTAGERKVVLDLLYEKLVRLGEEYRSDGVSRMEQKRLRTERRRVARLVNKLEPGAGLEETGAACI